MQQPILSLYDYTQIGFVIVQIDRKNKTLILESFGEEEGGQTTHTFQKPFRFPNWLKENDGFITQKIDERLHYYF